MYWGGGPGVCKDGVSCGEKGISWSGQMLGSRQMLTAAADGRLNRRTQIRDQNRMARCDILVVKRDQKVVRQ
jgi:hypothetical protein